MPSTMHCLAERAGTNRFHPAQAWFSDILFQENTPTCKVHSWLWHAWRPFDLHCGSQGTASKVHISQNIYMNLLEPCKSDWYVHLQCANTNSRCDNTRIISADIHINVQGVVLGILFVKMGLCRFTNTMLGQTYHIKFKKCKVRWQLRV